MKIVLFTHPGFFGSKSIQKFATMISEGMRERGHEVELITASPFFCRIWGSLFLKKWLGYLDQYLVFPFLIKREIKKMGEDTLFVFSDQALGPWISLVSNRPHVIHCHDLLAYRSARGEFPQNQTKRTGRFYQSYIYRGVVKGKHFIAISEKTAKDLKSLLGLPPARVRVVYNGLNYPYRPLGVETALKFAQNIISKDFIKTGFFLNVSGSQWYKNRRGIIEAYAEYNYISKDVLPLVIAGAPPSPELKELIRTKGLGENIHFVVSPENEELHALYVLAKALFYPSLEEGFGWPVIEAQASGTLVVATKRSPITEVGGESIMYLKRRSNKAVDTQWASEAGLLLREIQNMSESEIQKWIQEGFKNVRRFQPEKTLDEYERIYKSVLAEN